MLNSSKPNLHDRIGFLLCLLFAALISWIFHDKFWWGPDEGFYAYISQRILDGDIVHRDIQALHPGFLYYLNTIFLKLSGGDAVGLRYPLILITVFQAGLAYKICERYGILIAIAAAVSMTGFSFIQFVNPTPNWYIVTLTLCLAYIVDRADANSTRMILLIGLLVGIGFLMRQLSGAFLAIGVTAILFLKQPISDQQKKFYGGSFVLALLGLCLSAFILKSANFVGLALFGIYPPILIFWAATQSKIDSKTALSIIAKLTAGAILAAIPLILYHGATGTFGMWIHNSLIAPFRFTQLAHFDLASHGVMIYLPLMALLSGDISALNGLWFWTSLSFINPVLFVLVFKKLRKNRGAFPAAGILILFHGLVALYFEIHIYLTYTTALILVGLLINIETQKTRKIVAIMAIALSVTAIAIPAGRPLDRGLTKIALNKMTSWTPTRVIGTSIYTDEKRALYYTKIMQTINACAGPEDNIFALPVNPAIYFLSNRQPPFIYINSALGLANDDDVQASIKVVQSSPQPALIIQKEDDKYMTDFADDLMQQIVPLYSKIGEINDLTFYQRNGHPKTSECRIP